MLRALKVFSSLSDPIVEVGVIISTIKVSIGVPELSSTVYRLLSFNDIYFSHTTPSLPLPLALTASHNK